jgi:hypothetical protein
LLADKLTGKEHTLKLSYSADANGIYYPNLLALAITTPDIGVWSNMRKRCLKDYHPGLYAVMKTNGTLFAHLADINKAASERFELIVAQMMVAQSIDDTLKASDQMAWVGALNSIRASASEIVQSELIYR